MRRTLEGRAVDELLTRSQCCPMDTYTTDSGGNEIPCCTCGDGCACMCYGCDCQWGDDGDEW